MAERHDLLVEIGTEELPPKALHRLAQAFAEGMREALAKAELKHGALRYYATPRRLAVYVADLPVLQAERAVERRGPALTAAFDDEGQPTRAALGFAKSNNVAVDQLERMETAAGAWLVHRLVQPGAATRSLLPSMVEHALAELPTPKRMRWGNLRAEFVRPVQWVVLLFGDEVVDAELFGVRTGRETRGHRYHHSANIYISEPQAYAPLLETEGHVMPDFDARKEAIRAQVTEAAVSVGGRAVIDEALLEEVSALVEWPVAVLGNFEERFLQLPPEPLISTMKGNQKYFHLVDAQGKLMPHFITVANIESRDPAQVRAGNERVIRPRFSDAAFFWEQDCRLTLESRVAQLNTVVFQAKLGTLYDKVQRVAVLAAVTAERLGADAALAGHAARLSKSDLLTNMVREFPELQGIMGRHYALHEGLPVELAEAMDEQYLPRHAGDRLPTTMTGRALAIADKLDTLVGIFAIGQAPSGDKDPYALRRAALGVLRTLIECSLPLDLEALLNAAARSYPSSIPAAATVPQVYDFMMERLRSYYLDSGVRPDVFEAVLLRRPTRPSDFDQRIRAVMAFRELPEAESLAAASKRTRNILKQAADAIPAQVRADLLLESSERALAQHLDALYGEVTALFDQGHYTAALRRLASLREPVDTFFDKVMVMADDPALRCNRLALLDRMNTLFLQAADLSRLQ